MSNYNNLKAIIDANVKTNGNEDITGQILNSVLKTMVSSLGAGYQFAGKATPTGDPGTPDYKVFFIADTEGVYTNYGGFTLSSGIAIFAYDGQWRKYDITTRGGGGESQIFVAEYDDTASADIVSAIARGKIVLCRGYDYTDEKICIFVVGYADLTEGHEVIRFYATDNYRIGNITLSVTGGMDVWMTSWSDLICTTPSGDPMHYAYVQLGATWNATTGYWELNGLTDLTNDDIRLAYSYQGGWAAFGLLYTFSGAKARTLFCSHLGDTSSARSQKSRQSFSSFDSTFGATELEVINLNPTPNFRDDLYTSLIAAQPFGYMFYGSSRLKKIIGRIQTNNSSGWTNTFGNCSALESVKIDNLRSALSFANSPKLDNESILYVINHVYPSATGVVVTLHPTAYARAQEDASIQAALAAHANITIVSA